MQQVQQVQVQVQERVQRKQLVQRRVLVAVGAKSEAETWRSAVVVTSR